MADRKKNRAALQTLSSEIQFPLLEKFMKHVAVTCEHQSRRKEACEAQFSRMLQLCKVTSALFISNARSACSDELLQQEAVTLCINVSKQQPFPSAAAAAVTKLQIPVYDDPNEDLYVHFDRCADAIQKEASRGGRSVVYCKNGRSRSATVCIAYLMKHRKLALTDALQKVKTARHEIDPNPGFLSQLQRYEQELKRRRGRTDRRRD